MDGNSDFPRETYNMLMPQSRCFAKTVRELFSVKVPNSSFAEVRMELLPEPTHMEDEDEEQENEKEDDGEECRVEGRRVSRQQQHADDAWMTCAQDT